MQGLGTLRSPRIQQEAGIHQKRELGEVNKSPYHLQAMSKQVLQLIAPIVRLEMKRIL